MGTQDVELGISRDGYPALASWIADDPDQSTFIFRKFSRLSARNLLYLQAQVYELEKELDDLDNETATGQDVILKMSVRRWETFNEHAKKPGPVQRRMEVTAQIAIKLKEYHEALILQSNIAALESPDERLLRIFRRWFRQEKQGSGNSVIDGKVRKMLDDNIDLLALRTDPEEDMLSWYLRSYWPLEGDSRPGIDDGTRYYRLRHVSQAVAVISTIIALIDLVGAIVSLYYTKNPQARLGMIAGFTVLFGLSLRFASNAKRAEIFGACAAYAAVLVVFVSGDLGGSSSS
ncbi:hypothetical protein N7495_009732 [Penicillium taxi]|uniref:uncharacterized protein n=1 Tax=Penicillium taxi TaxID=168475 RepID=UPI0025458A04|nr:uncharacterized protein N7495_009732 [Penicillium taxi]KAJ5885222.1 hypothetical protein N7495_009732 [Penicillium taxi]